MTDSAVEPIALIRARGLTKAFGARTAVAGIDFDVRDGEFFGFLGPNGAGKTTTMRMIAGVSPRTSGAPEFFGQDPDLHGSEIRGRIGVVHQQDTFNMELTVRKTCSSLAGSSAWIAPVLRPALTSSLNCSN